MDEQEHGSGASDEEQLAAQRLVAKLKAFSIRELDRQERALFGALLVPGLARALDEEEVHGFGMVSWTSQQLPDALVTALRESGLRVIGLEEE